MWKIINYVEDRSGVLSNEYLKEFNEKFFEYEKNTWKKVYTLFFPNSSQKDFLKMWEETFSENFSKNVDKNNCFLLLVSTEEKKLKIISSPSADISFSKNIVENEMKEFLKTRDYNKILEVWFEFLEYNSFEKIENIDSKRKKLLFFQFIIFLFFIFVLVLGFFIFSWVQKNNINNEKNISYEYFKNYYED